MTAQAAEILHYKDREFALCAEPLDLYLENNSIRFDSETISTACWRGLHRRVVNRVSAPLSDRDQ